jgi:plastocyanin
MRSSGLECENGEQNTNQSSNYGKKSIAAAFVVGMLLGTLGLAAASAIGPAALTKFAAAPATRSAVTHGLRSGAPIMSDALDTMPEGLKLDPEGALDKAGSDFCSRRNALGRMASAAAAMIGAPALVSAAASVKMGSDSGQLIYVPSELTVCKGDTVTWVNNKGGPHNVVFQEGECPDGFDTDEASMDDVIGEPGGTFSYKFDIAGAYKYRCAPHSGAGMLAEITVK